MDENWFNYKLDCGFIQDVPNEVVEIRKRYANDNVMTGQMLPLRQLSGLVSAERRVKLY